MQKYKISQKQLIAMTIDSGADVTCAVDVAIKDFERDLEETTAAGDDVPLDFDIPVEDGDQNFVAEYESEDEDNDDELDYLGLEEVVGLSTVRVHCAAHKLQLGINDYLRKNERTATLIMLAQKLAAKLRTRVMRVMIAGENLPYAVLNQKTRWSSTYKMLEGLLKLKEFCVEKSATLPGLKLSAVRWNAIQTLCNALEPVALLTTQLQYEDLDVTQMVAFWKSAMFELQQIQTRSIVEEH